MKKIFFWLIDKWLGGFLIGSSLLILKMYVELPEDSKSNFFNFEWFTGILNVRITLWAVFLIVICLLIITRIEKSILKSKFISDVDDNLKIPKNPNKNYTSDVFGVRDFKWTWYYSWESNHQFFQIVNVSPCCPVCYTPMRIHTGSFHSQDYASCHRCRLSGEHDSFELTENKNDIELEIIRRIENNETGT